MSASDKCTGESKELHEEERMGRPATSHRMEREEISHQCSESKGVGVNTNWGGGVCGHYLRLVKLADKHKHKGYAIH